MINIFLSIGSDHIRRAIRLVLEQVPEYHLSGEADHAESLLAQVCTRPPDLLLLDWELPNLHPNRLIKAVRACCPHTLIVALGIRPEDELQARERGVDEFFLKNLYPEEFLDSIHSLTHQHKEA